MTPCITAISSRIRASMASSPPEAGFDGAGDDSVPSALSEDCVAFVRIIFEAGPTVVVEVVNQADDAPHVLAVRRAVAQLAGAGAHAGFDGERVLAQAFGLGELAQEFPGGFSCSGFVHR
jgi:hypothetical protein